MKRSTVTLLTALSALFSIQALAQIVGGDVLEFNPPEGPIAVSDGASTNKVKILRTPDGTLFAIYGDAQEVDLNGNSMAWNAKGSEQQKPHDIVIKFSIDGGVTWSAALNIDNTAALSSARGILVQEGQPMIDPATGTPDLMSDPRAVDYPGDSDKPNVFNIGNNIVVTWNGKYCPGGEQRFVVYPELFGITIPYSCQYAARLVWNSATKAFNTYPAWGGLSYKTEQLTTGIRDAKQDANRGNMYAYVLNWQEDPLGLKLGEAEGPGSGASGANVNNGTEVWYSHIELLNAAGTGVDPAKFVNGSWSTPVRITQNIFATQPLEGRDIERHPTGDYDRGRVGASRPNIGQIDNTVIIAYEETKGTEGWDEGKYIRYHHFRFDAPPVGGEHGCIISDPWQNSRRVRFLTQSVTGNEVPLLFIYKQGNYTQGGMSDIMLRRAVGGFEPEDLQPPVDVANCRASIMDDTDPLYAIRLEAHGPAMNFSGARAIGGQPGTGQMFEAIDTEANALENALAHRGMMRGDLMLIGFSYVPDLVQFLDLDDQAPYNFMVRRSSDAGLTWTNAINLTPEVTASSGYTVKEPRIVPTPGSGPRCATDPSDCQDADVIYIAYGLQDNVYDHYQEAGDIDIYMMVTSDAGASFSTPRAITAGDALYGIPDDFEDFETQIKLRPDGRASFTVWSGNDGLNKHAMFRSGEVRGDTRELATSGGSQSRLTVVPDARSEAVLHETSWKSLDDYPAPPANYNFPYGVLDFTVTRVALGGSIEVTLSFPEALPAGTSYWKFGSTPEAPEAHWYEIPAVIEGSTITYTLTDGVTGDDDLAVNGVIVDPAAPAIYSPPVAPPPPAPIPSGSSGGCTIGNGEEVDPTLLLLASLSLLYLARRRRMSVCC